MSMEKSLPYQLKNIIVSIVLALTLTAAVSGRILEEEPSVAAPVSGVTASGASPSVPGPAVASSAASGSDDHGEAPDDHAAAASGPGDHGEAPDDHAAAAAGPGDHGETPDDHAAAGDHGEVADDQTFSFFMHDILGGSNPSAIAVTGIVTNPSVSGQVAFSKPNGAVLSVNNGVDVNDANSGIISNNNIPFLTGLSGISGNVIKTDGSNNIIGGGFGFPALNLAQLGSGITFQRLMFGTLTVFDDELTEGHALNSGLVGKAQGFYVASSEDGTSQTMAFTVMFRSGSYADSLSFFGVHRIHVSESHLAIMGGTGKYVNAKGFATVKTIPAEINQVQETDGVQTVLHITVYLAY